MDCFNEHEQFLLFTLHSLTSIVPTQDNFSQLWYYLLPSKAQYGLSIEMQKIFTLQHKAPVRLCALHNNASSSIEKLQGFNRSEDENPYISPVLFIPD